MEFLRPIVVPVDGSTTVRIAALADDGRHRRAVIRSSDTGYQADHFTATLSYDEPAPEDNPSADAAKIPSTLLPLDPKADLYGPVLFQGNRFQRLLGYRHAGRPRAASADISNSLGRGLVRRSFHAGDLVLADPGTRDAMMHTLQCCVPDATLLPAGIEALSSPTRRVSRTAGTGAAARHGAVAATATRTCTTWTSAPTTASWSSAGRG